MISATQTYGYVSGRKALPLIVVR